MTQQSFIIHQYPVLLSRREPTLLQCAGLRVTGQSRRQQGAMGNDHFSGWQVPAELGPFLHALGHRESGRRQVRSCREAPDSHSNTRLGRRLLEEEESCQRCRVPSTIARVLVAKQLYGSDHGLYGRRGTCQECRGGAKQDQGNAGIETKNALESI